VVRDLATAVTTGSGSSWLTTTELQNTLNERRLVDRSRCPPSHGELSSCRRVSDGGSCRGGPVTAPTYMTKGHQI